MILKVVKAFSIKNHAAPHVRDNDGEDCPAYTPLPGTKVETDTGITGGKTAQ